MPMLGHELLETFAGLTAAPAVAAVMRHTARHPIANPETPTLAEITPEGAEAAEEFGACLTGFDRLRLFHSPVKRCGQTAACIAEGATGAGLKVELVGPREEIGVDFIVDQPEAGRLTLLHGDHFVRLWMEGKIPTKVVRPAREVALRHAAFAATRLRDPLSDDGRRLDLHISHDWNIIVLREILLGVRHEDTGWLTFLDGVTFTAGNDGIRALYREHVSKPLRF